MDVAGSDPDRLSVGSVAKSVVASFIPFRGIVREVTGAADHKRQFEAAIYAGAVRRGYLKGMGQQRKCPYPARPAAMRVPVPAVAQKPEKSAPVDDPRVSYQGRSYRAKRSPPKLRASRAVDWKWGRPRPSP